MKIRAISVLGFLLFIQIISSLSAAAIQYPATRRDNVVEQKFGISVADPYRWLEDDRAPEVMQWADTQGAFASGYLSALPRRQFFIDELSKIWNYDSFGIPRKAGDYYYFTKKTGLKNQPILYRAKSLDAEPEVFLDPNDWSADGTIALSSWTLSEDGSKMGILVSKAGSDWQEAQVIDTATKKPLSDKVEWIKFSGLTWDAKNEGFYYSRFDTPKSDTDRGDLKNQKVYYHKIGTEQKDDQLVFSKPDQPDWMFGVQFSDDKKYLMLFISGGTGRENQLWIKDLQKPDSEFVALIDKFEAEVSYIANDGEDFVFYTNKNAPRSKVVKMNLSKPEDSKDLIPEAAASIDGGVVALPDGYAVPYLENASSVVKIFDLNGNFKTALALPGIGSFGGLSADSKNETERFFSFVSFTTPTQIYRYDTSTSEIKLWKEADVKFDRSLLEVKQIFAPSKDGTLIPVFVVHRKDIKLDGSNPTLLYGYGGFNISLTPNFSVSWIPWIMEGGVYAIANLRGGGEFGDAWHNSGRLQEKQNVFDDFVGAAEKLISDGYTNPKKLAINGGSNGGLLVAKTLLQRPDLFAAAIPEVGVLDMIRFHLFTIGWAWKSDYGDPDIEKDFRNLYRYSPYHNIRLAAYPSTLIMTGDHDDRVVPAHSFKFAAALQYGQLGNSPILMRVQKSGGHGAGTPTSVLIEKAADRCAFALNAMGL